MPRVRRDADGRGDINQTYSDSAGLEIQIGIAADNAWNYCGSECRTHSIRRSFRGRCPFNASKIPTINRPRHKNKKLHMWRASREICGLRCENDFARRYFFLRIAGSSVKRTKRRVSRAQWLSNCFNRCDAVNVLLFFRAGDIDMLPADRSHPMLSH